MSEGNLEKRVVALVEDDNFIRDYLREKIESKWDLKVHAFRDAESFLVTWPILKNSQAYIAEQVLMILDQVLPNMSGDELALILKNRKDTRDKFIILGVSASPAKLEKGKDKGVFDFTANRDNFDLKLSLLLQAIGVQKKQEN